MRPNIGQLRRGLTLKLTDLRNAALAGRGGREEERERLLAVLQKQMEKGQYAPRTQRETLNWCCIWF